MKKGKTEKLNGFKTSKVHYGTVDSKNFKSLYLNIQTWVEPKKDTENWLGVVSNTSRSIKHSIYNRLDQNFLKQNFIVDLDLRTSGIQVKKKSFMNLEITLFLNDEIDFKSPALKKELKKLTKDIYSDVLVKHEYFKFYLTKYGNSKPQKVKTENI
jgi:hypothetical protein